MQRLSMLHRSRAVPRRRYRPELLLLLTLLLTGCAIPRWPVHGTLTSPFGLRRDGLRLHIHHGVDIAVTRGTPVRAIDAGRVTYAGTLRGYGHVIIIEHHPRLHTLYAHLAELHVRTGDHIEGRSILGLAGSSGRATGPHLHFEIWRDRRPEDPVPLLGQPPPPPRPSSS